MFHVWYDNSFQASFSSVNDAMCFIADDPRTLWRWEIVNLLTNKKVEQKETK
tara:strand:- start:74 stop:229 length:156 start_codon:yes stop_codon:yes gene_type:complete